MDFQIKKMPILSIPKLEDLSQYDIGLWVWSKLDRAALASTVKAYLDQHVFIEHLDGRWTAGARVDREYQIVGIWQEGTTGSIGKLLGTHGKYAKNINPEFDDAAVTNRIWSYLAGDALGMHLREAVGKNEYSVAPNRDWEISKFHPFV